MSHKPSNKANEVWWSVQSLDGTTELLHCFIFLLHNVNSPWPNTVCTCIRPSCFTLRKTAISRYLKSKTCTCSLGTHEKALLSATTGSKASVPWWGSPVLFVLVVFYLAPPTPPPNVWRSSGWARTEPTICRFGSPPPFFLNFHTKDDNYGNAVHCTGLFGFWNRASNIQVVSVF